MLLSKNIVIPDLDLLFFPSLVKAIHEPDFQFRLIRLEDISARGLSPLPLPPHKRCVFKSLLPFLLRDDALSRLMEAGMVEERSKSNKIDLRGVISAMSKAESVLGDNKWLHKRFSAHD